MRRDFSVLPSFLDNLPGDLSPRAWGLCELGEMLQFSYDLLEHPFFKDAEDYRDPFIELMRSPEIYNNFNRTIIERIILDASHYGRAKLDFGTPVMTSRGIETVLDDIKTFLIIADEFERNSESEKASLSVGLWIYRANAGGATMAAVKYCLGICRTLLSNLRAKIWESELAGISLLSDRRNFLLRKTTDLKHSAVSTDPIILNHLNTWLRVELEFLTAILPDAAAQTIVVNNSGDGNVLTVGSNTHIVATIAVKKGE